MAKALEMNYGNVREMKKNGWTAEDFEALKIAPRTKEAALPNGPEGGFVWPCVNGKRLLYTFFNEKERELYRPWYNAHHPKDGTTSKSSAGKSNKIDNEAWLKLYQEIAALDNNAVAMDLLSKMMPESLVTPEMKVFGKILSDEDKAALTKEPLPLYRVLFRYPSGRMNDKVVDRKSALTIALDDETFEQRFQVADIQQFIDAGYIRG